MTRSLEQSIATSHALQSTVQLTDAAHGHAHTTDAQHPLLPFVHLSVRRTNLPAQLRKAGKLMAADSLGWSSSLAKGTSKQSAHRRPSFFSTPVPQQATKATKCT